MGAKKTVQKQGSHEKELLRTGQQRADLGRRIAARPTKYVNETSTKDYSKLYRGRLAADAAQKLAQPSLNMYATAADQGKGLSGVLKVEGASSKARGSALSEGSARGIQSRDKNIFSAMDVSMGKQAGSSRNMRTLANMQASEIETQAKIAADEANNKRGALTGLATMAVGAYQQNKMDKMYEQDVAAFENAKKAGLVPQDASYADFSQNFEYADGSRGALYQNKNLSWSNRFFNALGGAG